MYSLQSNSEILQASFKDFHSAVSGRKIPGQKLLHNLLLNCLTACHATNEISGVRFMELPGHQTALINPIFIDGSTNHGELLREAVGDKYAALLESTSVIKSSMQFNARKNWSYEHLVCLEKISTLKDPARMLKESLLVAMSLLDKSPHRMAMVCGPMSTSGILADNQYLFNRTIMEVAKAGPVFNQLPFENVFKKVHELLNTTHAHVMNVSEGDTIDVQKKKRSEFFIESFYERIIRDSRKSWHPYFMYGWEKSVGASIEHALFKMLKFDPYYLEKGFVSLN